MYGSRRSSRLVIVVLLISTLGAALISVTHKPTAQYLSELGDSVHASVSHGVGMAGDSVKDWYDEYVGGWDGDAAAGYGMGGGELKPIKTEKQRMDLVRRLDVLYDFVDNRKAWPKYGGRDYDRAAITRLSDCLKTNTCGRNETTVVLLCSWDFVFAQSNIIGGETVWSISLVNAFKSLNYTLLYPVTSHDVDFYNQQLGDRIPVILWEPGQLKVCMNYVPPTPNATEAGYVLEEKRGGVTLSERGEAFSALAVPRPRSLIEYAGAESAESAPGCEFEAESGAEAGSGHAPLEKRSWWDDPLYMIHNDGTPARGCMQTPEYPEGVEMWKSVSFDFWVGPDSPLGPGWTLSPVWYHVQWDAATEWADEDGVWLDARAKSDNRFVGYSIQERCELVPFIPHDERKHRGMVLGKIAWYYTKGAFHNMFPALGANLTAETGSEFTFVSTARSTESEPFIEPGIELLGYAKSGGWFDELSNSRVLVGMGRPLISPSPYDALCLGVPFINVITDWNHQFPDNRTLWNTQHADLRDIDPPYVYHVRKGDEEGLHAAVRAAVETPIDRFIPDRMSFAQVQRRMEALVKHDWRGLAQRTVKGSGYNETEYPWLL